MLEYRDITDFPRGTLYTQLADAYSFHPQCRAYWDADWQAYDTFMYDNPAIAAKYGFVTVLDGIPIGHITWDPRNRPAYVIVGHNCILCACKGRGYGAAQLQEALRRIRLLEAEKVIVCTNELFLPAQRNYERAGFIRTGDRENTETPFAGRYIDYELLLK